MFYVKWRNFIVNMFDTFTWILISFILILCLVITITFKYLFNKKVNTIVITLLLLNLIVFYFTNNKIENNKKYLKVKFSYLISYLSRINHLLTTI